MNNKFKFLTVLVALALVLGVFAPLTAVRAEEEHKTTVIVHKMELKDLKGWPKSSEDAGNNGKKYDGSKLDLTYFGEGASELKDVKFIYWKVTEEQYNTMLGASADYNTVEKVNAYLKDEANKGTAVITTADGAKIEGLVDGYYWFVEDTNTVSRDGRTFSGAAAVPFGLTLPYAMADGTPFGTEEGKELHVYPKNKLADKPKVDKDFEGKANPEKPREDKNSDLQSHTVGDMIPYEVKTVFPAGAQYKTAYWADQMTEGLTFNNDVKVVIGEVEATSEDYSVDTTVNSFKVVLTEKGLAKVNNQEKEITVTVKYSATLNGNAVVEIPESNDVTFHYGNNPSKGNTPVPNKPKEGKIKVTKSFNNVDKKEVQVQLYNAQTGEKVGEVITLTAPNYEYTWEGLDNDIEYKVKEITEGFDVVYSKGELGELKIENNPTDNPTPVNPEEPKVVTYGKKFVKTDGKGNVLEGAEFYVKNENGNEFLKKKSNSDIEAAKQALEAAKKAYEKAITDKDQQKADELYPAYEKALRVAATQYEWTTDEKEAIVLTSNVKGQFVIAGLKEGTYKLVEKTAPKGFAKLEGPVTFNVDKNSWKTGDIDFKTAEKGEKDALEVVNKKVTIPQTGGIGTIIFTVGGLALMAGAAFALKKSKEDELEGLA